MAITEKQRHRMGMIRQLRKIKAPAWVLKYEQTALVADRRRDPDLRGVLFKRYVEPLMGGGPEEA